MRSVALLLTMSLFAGGCFPHNEKKRTFAQIGEGAAIVGGIVIAAVSNTGADCDAMIKIGTDPADCKTKATILGDLGLGLLLAGLVGFIATVTTAEDDKENELPGAPVKPTTATGPVRPANAPQPMTMPAPATPQ